MDRSRLLQCEVVWANSVAFRVRSEAVEFGVDDRAQNARGDGDGECALSQPSSLEVLRSRANSYGRPRHRRQHKVPVRV